MKNNQHTQVFSKQLIAMITYRNIAIQVAIDLLTDDVALWWVVLMSVSTYDESTASNAYARHGGRQFDLSKDKANERERTRSGGFTSGVSFKNNASGNVIEEKDTISANPNEETSGLLPATMSVTSNANGDTVYKSDYAWGYFKDAPTGSHYGGSYKRTYEWDSRNLLIASSDNTNRVHYTYDANGERTNKYTYRSETLYFNTFWNWHRDSAISNGQFSKNIYLGTTRLVTKLHNSPNEWPSSQATTANCYYYHSDHLGSAQLITDYKGNEYQRLEYTPYGELWIEKTSSAVNTKYLPYKFTGKERDEETGLYYFGARYLDAKYSRWLSADPALSDYVPLAPVDDNARRHNENLPGMGGVFNTVNLQLYHYSANNPIKYVDPDGEFATIVGAVIGGIGGALSALAQGNKLGSKEFKAGVVGGAVAGAIAGAALDIAAATVATGGTAALVIGTVGGAIGGGTGSMIESAISGDQIKAANVICDAIIGGLGAFGGQLVGKGLQKAFQSKLTSMLLNSKTGKDVLILGTEAGELSLVFGKKSDKIMQILAERGVDEAIAFVTDVLQDKINPGINED